MTHCSYINSYQSFLGTHGFLLTSTISFEIEKQNCLWSVSEQSFGVFSFHSRVGQRGGGLNSSAARSEHEVSEIIDGISEHEVSSSFEHAP